jgi:hypothetical protein
VRGRREGGLVMVFLIDQWQDEGDSNDDDDDDIGGVS